MSTDSFQINIPKEFYPLIDELEGPNFDAKVKVSLALGLFVNEQVTLARAAQLSGKSLSDFIDLLGSKNIPWMEYSEEHLQDDQRVIKEILGDKKADE
jgi:predicted HTH domain antitoxin